MLLLALMACACAQFGLHVEDVGVRDAWRDSPGPPMFLPYADARVHRLARGGALVASGGWRWSRVDANGSLVHERAVDAVVLASRCLRWGPGSTCDGVLAMREAAGGTTRVAVLSGDDGRELWAHVVDAPGKVDATDGEGGTVMVSVGTSVCWTLGDNGGAEPRCAKVDVPQPRREAWTVHHRGARYQLHANATLAPAPTESFLFWRLHDGVLRGYTAHAQTGAVRERWSFGSKLHLCAAEPHDSVQALGVWAPASEASDGQVLRKV